MLEIGICHLNDIPQILRSRPSSLSYNVYVVKLHLQRSSHTIARSSFVTPPSPTSWGLNGLSHLSFDILNLDPATKIVEPMGPFSGQKLSLKPSGNYFPRTTLFPQWRILRWGRFWKNSIVLVFGHIMLNVGDEEKDFNYIQNEKYNHL